MKTIIFPTVRNIGMALFAALCLQNCSSGIPSDFSCIEDYHKELSPRPKSIEQDNLSLYVDYSTCISLGQSSQFFQALIPSIRQSTKNYYSIKGLEISKDSVDVFSELRSINEVNYADLRTAVQLMADGNSESMILTDCEFFEPTIAKGHINDPYLANAFKTWLLKGHDIYIISEPYEEIHNGNSYNKKRFYIMFTDSRLANNIWYRISNTVDLTEYAYCDTFHMSIDHIALFDKPSVVNPSLAASINRYGRFETQEWTVDWNTIQNIIMSTNDTVTKDIKIDRNGFGGFRVDKVALKTQIISNSYVDYYVNKQKKVKAGVDKSDFVLFNGFMLDPDEFKSHGNVNIKFSPVFDGTQLQGNPYNYFKIDVIVDSFSPINDGIKDMFSFQSIDKPGYMNTSVYESIKQCMVDSRIKEYIKGQTIYTLYIQSNKY